jgi:hypothetical protein
MGEDTDSTRQFIYLFSLPFQNFRWIIMTILAILTIKNYHLDTAFQSFPFFGGEDYLSLIST